MKSSQKHEVKRDYVGLNSRPRLTCYSCHDTLVCQPYMTKAAWDEKSALFKKKHNNIDSFRRRKDV